MDEPTSDSEKGVGETPSVARREAVVLAILCALLVVGVAVAWLRKAGWGRGRLELAPADSRALYRVNVNTAGRGELEELPGIGAARAEAIVAYRDAHADADGRAFESPDDLVEKGLVPPHVLEEIRGSITVGEKSAQ